MQEETFELNMSSIMTVFEDQLEYYSTLWFIEEVEKRSEGRIKINYYDNNQLVPADSLLDALSQGTADIGFTTPLYYGDLIKSAQLGALPYWAENPEQGLEILRESEIGKLAEDEFASYGVQPLVWAFYSNSGFMLNKKIETFEDMKGLAIRTTGGLTTPWLKEMGAAGVVISLAEIYDALQKGTVDGHMSAYQGLEATKWGEVVDYVVNPPIINASPTVLLMSTKAMEKLPKDLQDIILEVSKEAESLAMERGEELSGKLPEIYEKYDIEVINLPEEESQKFFESAQSVWDDFAAMSETNAEIIELLRVFHSK